MLVATCEPSLEPLKSREDHRSTVTWPSTATNSNTASQRRPATRFDQWSSRRRSLTTTVTVVDVVAASLNDGMMVLLDIVFVMTLVSYPHSIRSYLEVLRVGGYRRNRRRFITHDGNADETDPVMHNPSPNSNSCCGCHRP